MNFNIEGDLSPEQRSHVVKETVEDFNAYLNRWPEPKTVDGAVVEWIGEGCILRDVHGREFIDCLGGFGIFALGHRKNSKPTKTIDELAPVYVAQDTAFANPFDHCAVYRFWFGPTIQVCVEILDRFFDDV